MNEPATERAALLLRALYGDDADDTLQRAMQVVEQTRRSRRVELLDLDAQRSAQPDWFASNQQIGYVAYADRFGDTLSGVRARLDHLSSLQVTYFHLMAVLRNRPAPNDGGYAVVDYGDVEPHLGHWADLVGLADELRARGISLCLDVVMNHTAAEHPWAKAARAGSTKHRNYFLVFPDRVVPDAFEATLPEVFPELAPGNFTWDHDLGGWVWTTFNTYQWDLNYANPDVFIEMLSVICHLANAGVDVMRLDAIAFTWKRKGTNCQNQPEAHVIAQALREFVTRAAPAVLLKAEAIVAPDDLLPYLGAHQHGYRPECHLAYHNQLMVQTWSSLATGDARLARASLEALPPTPAATAFVTYVRCHDDIGWAIDDERANSVGLNGPAHRRFLAEWYRGDRPGSWARGVAFSTTANDERTCGMTAALTGLADAEQRGEPAEIELGLRRSLVAYAIALGYGGIPLIYMGDEVALGDDADWFADPAHGDDSRWVHRPRMDWGRVEASTIPGTIAHRMRLGLQHLIDVRRATPALSTGGETYVHRLEHQALLGIERRHRVHGRWYGLANLSSSAVEITEEVLGWAGLHEPQELLGATQHRRGRIVVPGYAMGWFVER
jgi:amylosucrase